MAFDSIGNLFVAHIKEPDDIGIGRVLKFNLRNHVSTFGSATNFEFEGLALDAAGNVYVMGTDINSPTAEGTIFKFTASGERIVFGSVPGTPDATQANWGLAFDSAGNLYAADGNAQTIYEFAPNGTRTVFVGPSAFEPGESPVGLAFDSSGNLFVSIETFSDPGADSIVYFSPTGVKSPFATGLTFPRGLAFDSSGNLFVAEANPPPDGDILEFAPDGSELHRFCLRLRPPGIPHLRAPAITGLARAAALHFFLQRGAKFSVFCTPKRLQKNLKSDDHFDCSFSPYRDGRETKKKRKEQQ